MTGNLFEEKPCGCKIDLVDPADFLVMREYKSVTIRQTFCREHLKGCFDGLIMSKGDGSA